jgi:hypothetical protein
VSSPPPNKGLGWTTSVLLEAHVVNLRDAAAQGSKGLLQPLLKRYQVGWLGGCIRSYSL